MQYPIIYKNIVYSSQLFLISSMVGYYNKLIDLASITFLVYCTSTLYWINPGVSYRRYLDFTAVQFGIYYHCLRAIDSDNMYNFYILTSISSIFGIYSFNKYKNKEYRISVFYHMLMHITSNSALLLLYTNKIVFYSEANSQFINTTFINIIICISFLQMIGISYYIDKY